jgi:hypothetical protein
MWTYGLEHLDQLTTQQGIFEHAKGTVPREERGYCTDDNARLLVVMSREPDADLAYRLSRTALRFVLSAQSDAGMIHNRFALDGYWQWVDEASTDDCWGRAVWGLGVAAASHPNGWVRSMAQWGFERSARQRSPWLHATAFAALGAADVLGSDPSNDIARSLLVDAVVELLPTGTTSPRWPEERLTYANAAIPEALIAAGAALQVRSVRNRGLAMLEWLLEQQTRDGHLSVVGTSGRALTDVSIQFDQQPIEVAALADACWRAWSLTGDARWRDGVAAAGAWFAGLNDSRVVMFDEANSGGYDGLEPGGRNVNEGAESTLAFVSTMQRASALRPWRTAAVRNRPEPPTRFIPADHVRGRRHRQLAGSVAAHDHLGWDGNQSAMAP